MADRPCPPELVEVGELAGLHGVRGAFRVISHTRPRENLCRYPRWSIQTPEGDWRAVDVVDAQSDGVRVLARLEGIEDRDAARAWLGARIAVEANLLPAPKAGEYYWRDLIGLQAQTPDGTSLGEVTSLFETPANDVLVVRDEGHERLIPFIQGHYVLAVDLVGGRICLDWDPRD